MQYKTTNIVPVSDMVTGERSPLVTVITSRCDGECSDGECGDRTVSSLSQPSKSDGATQRTTSHRSPSPQHRHTANIFSGNFPIISFSDATLELFVPD